MPAVRLQVAGRVQGVGFRWFVRVAGRRLRLAGWVKNNADGTVEVSALGAAEQLDEFRRLVERGPEGANVSEVRELEPGGENLPFPFAMRR